jgi:hypothetical protein
MKRHKENRFILRRLTQQQIFSTIKMVGPKAREDIMKRKAITVTGHGGP